MIDIKTFESDLLKIDKKSYKEIDIYNIGYITIKKIDDNENIYSVNPSYLTINHAGGYIEEKGVNKYYFLILQMTIKSYLKNKMIIFNGIRNKIKKISGNECEYEKDYIKLNLIQMMIYH